MPETNNSNELSIDQVQAILKNDHIRQHLIQVGYIDRRGNIIHKDEDNRHSRRPHTSNRRSSPISADYDSVTPNHRRPIENISDSRRPVGSRSPDYNGNDHRLKSASTVQSKGTNKSHTSTRFSSSNQPTCVQNILLRRAVSPKILPAKDRCLVTLMYYGPDLNIEYDRDLFEPDGDEILVLQQHCGGENFRVFKGFLKPDEIFSFESRRHTDYPFALAFYINGVIKDRLSICCESRCKDFMPIGGKHCIFAIKKVEKARVCRRCRFEERMKKIIAADPKLSTDADRRRRERWNKSLTSSSKSPKSRTKNSKSTSADGMNSKTTAAPKSSLEKNESRKSSSESTVPLPIKVKPAATRTSSSESIESDISSPKQTAPPKKSSKTTAVHNSNPQQVESGTTSPKPTVPRAKSSKINGARSSSPEQVESGTSSPEPTVARMKKSKNNAVRSSSPQQVESGTSSPEPTAPRAKSSKINGARSSSPQQVESGTSSLEPTVARMKKSKNNAVRSSSPQQVESGTSSPEPVVPRTKSSKIHGALSSSPQPVESGTSSPEPTVSHTTISNAPVVRTPSPKRHESPPPTRVRSATVSNHQRKVTNPPSSSAPNFKEPEKTVHSSTSTPRENKLFEVSSSDSSESRPKNQHRALIVSTKSDSDDEVVTITDESNPDFERFLAAPKLRKNSDD